LLSGLPAEAWESLRPKLEPVALGVRQVLVRPNEPFDFIYFPERSLASITTALDDGTAVEVGIVGREGMVGLPVVLGVDLAPSLDVYIQIADGGWRMEASLLRPEMERSPVLRERLFRYALARQAQISRTAACNARHPINERLARWLLMAREAVQRDELALTQEFLSMMLGVRRAGVSVAAGTLRRAGLIANTPGHVTILDPAGLEAAACDCFGFVQQEYERLLG
jgi:CRP-like cAMP-binding protein